MPIKICKKCNTEKDIEQFRFKKDKNGNYYIYSYCKECEKINNKKYYNKEKIHEKNKKYRENNIEKIKSYYNNDYLKQWRQENPDKVKQYIKSAYNKTQKIPILKIKAQARDTIRNGFRRKGFSKNTKTEKLLECDYNIFIEYLLKTFENNYGYKWNGIETVHIDHITPLATAKTKEDVIKLCHYTNLQLLKAEDNFKKGKKIIYKIGYNL